MCYENHVVVLSTDYKYINNMTATIKSLLFNNYKVKIYIINSDIPQEWFQIVNSKINQIGSQIIDIKIDPALLDNLHLSFDYLAPAAYGKLLISDYIKEDRAVYIDSDVIVDDDISELFTRPFENGKLYMAVQDIGNPSEFNDGIIVANCKELRKIPNLTRSLLEQGKEQNLNSDQSIFNAFFINQVQKLPQKYNFQVGFELNAQLTVRYNMAGKEYWRSILDNQFTANISAKMYHYVTGDKPWKTNSSGHWRYKWWQYYKMEWQDIINHYHSKLHPISTSKLVGQLVVVTESGFFDQLEELIKALPQWNFSIMTLRSAIGSQITHLSQYPNTRIYPLITEYDYQRVLTQADAYVDLNQGLKYKDIINDFIKSGRPAFTFEQVSSQISAENYHVFDENELSSMVSAIEQLKQQ